MKHGSLFLFLDQMKHFDPYKIKFFFFFFFFFLREQQRMKYKLNAADIHIDLWQYSLAAHRYINFFETILSWPVIRVVLIWVSHISFWPQEIQLREWEKKNKEQTNNKGVGQLKVQEGEFCNTAFPMHLQTNTSVYS